MGTTGSTGTDIGIGIGGIDDTDAEDEEAAAKLVGDETSCV
jgi:hypothetical protein